MKILVTGGAGYVGSHVCKLLAAQGHQPVVFDNLERGNRDAVKWGEFILGDLRDSQSIQDAMADASFDGVMHFAAYAYVGESIHEPKKYLENNVMGTINLIDAMVNNNIRRLIFSSTCAVYGTPETSPVSESHAIQPESPYGLSKVMAENVIQQYRKLDLIDPVILRYFNVVGSDPDGEIGECHEPETHIIPIAIEVAMGRRDEFLVFGDNYKTQDGTGVRDYIHVNDLAAAHIKALENISDLTEHYVFNLGTEMPYSVLEIIKNVEVVTSSKIKLNFVDRREGDAESLYANASLAKKYLSWEPSFPDIRLSILHAYSWFKKKT